jgi:hypothetical protein
MDIGTKELRNRLSEILDRVGRGERIRIVRRMRHARGTMDNPQLAGIAPIKTPGAV